MNENKNLINIIKYNDSTKLNHLLHGIIKIFNNGYAFVFIKKYNEKIFISKNKTGIALDQDEVLISLKKDSQSKIKKGEVVKIIKRKKKYVIGTLFIKQRLKKIFLIVKSLSIHKTIYIKKNSFKNLKNNTQVVVLITDWPYNFTNPIGKIVKILDYDSQHYIEMNSILTKYSIPLKFPKKVINEANKIAKIIENKEIKSRFDLRGTTTFTIDPLDAKDFDDAISLKKLNNKIYEIGIHIADVSFYVKKNSSLDKEAYKRSTSIYLVQHVVPMLPEIISNDICSLNPKEDKLTFSIIFHIDIFANISNIWFGKTVIRSEKRFNYDEVQNIIENKKGIFYKEILILNKIAKTLKKKRIDKGSINIISDEIKFHFDKNGKTNNIYIKKYNDANYLIEEFMLLANNKVSEFVSLDSNGKNSNYNYIYRVHDKPDIQKLNELKKIIKILGYKLNIKNKQKISNSLNELLESAKEKPEKNIINNLVMRTMSKANYSYNNIGHYGLALSYYTHFTSPIRRYPDIIAHRLLENKLLKIKPDLTKISEQQNNHFIKCERLANEIERESIRYTQIKYIKSFIKYSFKGIISGINNWGIYIQLLQIKIDGMIRIKNLSNDRYKFNKKKYTIIGKKYGKEYRIGQEVNVKIIRINEIKRQIDLELID